jgi:carboxymethylenebutenolidase
MNRKGVSWSIILILGSMLLFPNYMNFIHAQSVGANNPIKNVTALSNSFGNGTGVELQNSTIHYFEDADGYLVFPVGKGNQTSKLPAVIMIHENKGLNDHIKNMANLLARQGYVVLAVDLFKGEVSVDPNDTRRMVQSVRSNPEHAISNLQTAVKYVSSLPNVDSSKVASIGWCFGGGQSLQLALNSQDHPLAATILYYGTPLVTDKGNLSKINWPVLGIFGDQDRGIPVEKVNQFKASLEEAGITNEIHIYPGVGHAFANPSGANYAPKETQDAWQKTLSFLSTHLG